MPTRETPRRHKKGKAAHRASAAKESGTSGILSGLLTAKQSAQASQRSFPGSALERTASEALPPNANTKKHREDTKKGK